MESKDTSHENKSSKKYAVKKRLNIDENSKDIENSIDILTNLSYLNLNPNAIQGVYLYGCDIEEQNHASNDFNPVNLMRKARKLKCFQDKIKEYVPNYYISGLVLMGKPKDNNEENQKFQFYLNFKDKDGIMEGAILKKSQIPENTDEKIYKFKVKRKNEDLSKMKEDESSGNSQCVANYLNICLGKILKKCGYTKDRSTRKILYYNKNEALEAKMIYNSDYLFFPALKAVCETYEGGIFMKLLPKRLLKTCYTYEDYFNKLKTKYNSLNETLKKFKEKVLYKRGIKIYNQSFIKIEDVIYDNPYNIKFTDKSGKEWSVGDYLNQYWKMDIIDEEMPIAVRIIDKGGKLKGKDISYIHIPCRLLEIIGNIFDDKINVKDIVQPPYVKYDEINYIRRLIEENALNSNNDYLGEQFEPLIINGQIIKPPLIQFDNNIVHEAYNGSFDLLKTSPYSKTKELNKIDIYLLDLNDEKANFIWEKLNEASKELGITFKQNPTFYPIDDFREQKKFEDYISDYFNKVDKYYNDKKNETDFIFMFMDSRKKNTFHYKSFKSIINQFNWSIPTQVILYDDKKMSRSTNLSQFTNILCQMWAKKGNELYICDFIFVPKTMVIAYSSMAIQDKKILTSMSIGIGTKLYEYMFYSEITDNTSNDYRISPSIESLLIKSLKTIGKHLKKNIENIVIYRDAVNEKQQDLIERYEVDFIKKAINKANNDLEKKVYTDAKWCLILVSKINEIKMFLETNRGGNNKSHIDNIPVGTLIDKKITNKDKFDFYLNSAESRQGTCSSTHYTVLYDDTKLSAIQIYKLTYYLTYLSYNTTKSIRVPAPLYFVTRRNKFTSENLKGQVVNPKFRTLNISL